MRPLSPPNIESELSYAYLHAVAAHAGMDCRVGSRHEDGNGIDAQVTAWGPFTGGSYLTEVDIKVQLKATIAEPVDDGASLSYFLSGVRRYDDLRAETVEAVRILVVLFLPRESNDWLKHSAEELALRRCAYWVSLRGAPPTDNATGATVKVPKAQVLTPEALQGIAAMRARREFPSHQAEL